MSNVKRRKKEPQVKVSAGLQTKQTWLPYALLVPCFAFFFVFVFYPFAKAVYLSFTLTDMFGKPVKWVGMFNYLRVFKNPDFWNMMKITFTFALMVGIGTFLVALIFALLSVDQVKGGKIYQVMFSLPMAIASVPAASMLNPIRP